MYTPPHFAMDDLADQHALIEANDFAVLVATGSDGLVATHVPMMLRRDEGPLGTLYAHLARPNPQARLAGQEMLAVFSGPHGYVSPSWYLERAINVPTWNYAAVHCYGVVEVHPGEAIELLAAMTDAYEGQRPNGWSVGELDARVRESLPKGVVALRMQITRIEGKAKLSQNKPRLERERVISELKAAGETRLAAVMQTELDKV